MPAEPARGQFQRPALRPGLPSARPGLRRRHSDTIGRRGQPLSGNFDRLCGSGRIRDSIPRANVT